MKPRWNRFASLATVVLLGACAADSTGDGAARPSPLADAPGAGLEAAGPADPLGPGSAPCGRDPSECDCGGDRPTVDGQIAEPACDRQPMPETELTADPIPLGDSPRLGRADADVVVVFSADLQCGYCSRAHETMKKLVQAYAGRVAVVFKHNPLPMHDHALDAAVAVEAARRQGKFWEMLDVLFAHQDRLDRPSLSEWAGQIGLDVRAFEADLASPELAQSVRADQQIVRTHGGRGTPTFWVGDRRLVGAHPLDTFKTLVDDALRSR